MTKARFLPLFAIFLVCAIAIPATAQDAARSSQDYLRFLSSQDSAQLTANGEVTNVGTKIDDLALWQQSPFADQIRAQFKDFEATLSAEGFFLIDEPTPPGPALNRRIYDSITSFSQLKGLQVYSVSKDTMETFIYDASRVSSMENPQHLPDVATSAIPAHADYTVWEQMENTGNSYSEFTIDFDKTNDIFTISITNLTTLDFLFFTLAEPQHVKTYFIAIPCADRLVLYGVTAVSSPLHLFGLERIKEKSFYYQMRALIAWFTANLKSAG